MPHPAARRPRAATAVAEGVTPALDRGAIEAAYRKAVTAGEFDISLQPIVSVSTQRRQRLRSVRQPAVEGGERIDLRRLAQTLPGVESAMFERILVTTALNAGRKRLGAASTAMPLHVAISEAILGDAKEFAPLLDMLQFYPDLAASIVLSMPSRVFESGWTARAGAGAVVGKGRPLRRRGLERAANVAAAIGVEGLDFLKIPADRLLDREKQRRKLVAADDDHRKRGGQ